MFKPEDVTSSIAQGQLNNSDEDIDFDPELNEIFNTSAPSASDGDDDPFIEAANDSAARGSATTTEIQNEISKYNRSSECSSLAVGISAEASDQDLKGDLSDEENKARGALKQILCSKIEASLIASRKNTEDLASVQSYLLYEIAYALRHGSPTLFFRLFRGPVGEDGLWAGTKSFFYNGITLFGKTHYTRPKPIATDADQKEIAQVISDSVKEVCKKQL